MNAGATSERVYEALKHRILVLGFRPGERLDPAKLGDDLHSSVTPVRDALHLLTGERLVELSGGFHVAAMDAPSLQDLYEWNAQILALAVRSWRPEDPPVAAETDGHALSGATAAAAFFLRIAARSMNVEHRRAVLSANDRLNAARLCEALVIPGGEREIATMRPLFARGDKAGLRKEIVAYHRRRKRAAHALVRALYRKPDPGSMGRGYNIDIGIV